MMDCKTKLMLSNIESALLLQGFLSPFNQPHSTSPRGIGSGLAPSKD